LTGASGYHVIRPPRSQPGEGMVWSVMHKQGERPLSPASHASSAAGAEKRWIALTSVAAAVLLTGLKLVVGFLTGSLGLLAEAAHSALDFVAAFITYFAVRLSDKPADREHLYGHGKIENLSAMVETILLLVTCVWIIYEAVERLFFRQVAVEATFWSFLVIAVSIVVDVSRSRALYRVAQKHKSQALEADALHFSTDVWSSVVVLLGLVLVRVGDSIGGDAAIFQKADALAALLVAFIVVYVSFRLGRRTIDALLDRAPPGMVASVEEAVGSLDGVLQCRDVRLREAGNRTFIDLTIAVPRDLSLESSHALGHTVEARILALWPDADVIVHVDPMPAASETLVERIRAIAANCGQRVHNITVTEDQGRIGLEMHVETNEDMDLHQAHKQADRLEEALRGDIPNLFAITTHIEPLRESSKTAHDVTAASAALVERIKRTALATPGIVECHDVVVRRSERRLHLTMHCSFAAGSSISDVHAVSSELEQRLRREIPDLDRVTTHPEPLEPE
jgi:cation diffusion facilitator family transporter